MKNDLAYWEKNKEYLQKHFLDWEEFVCAEKFDRNELKGHLTEALLTAMVPLLAFIACCFFSIYSAILMAALSIFTGALLLLKISQGAFLPHWLILTTRGVSYCCGENCQIVYQWAFSEIQEMYYSHSQAKKKDYLHLYPQMPFNSFLSAFRKNDSCYRFFKNELRIKQGKEFRRSMRSLSSYFGGARVYRERFSKDCICMHVDNDSDLSAALKEVLRKHPNVKYTEHTEPAKQKHQ